MYYLSSKEVANKIGCTPRNVALLVKSGKLTPVNSHKDFFLFDIKEVELFNSKKRLSNGN